MDIIVRMPLLPGHGTHLGNLNGISWKDWVEAVRESIHSLKISCDELFLIGLSMGGTIALLLAQESQCRGIVCLATPVKMKQWMQHILPVLRPFKKEWEKKRDPAIDKHTAEMGYDRYTTSSLIEFMKILKVCRKQLHRVTCPILIMHARDDRTVPANNAEIIYRNVCSREREILLLDHPAHMITRGKNQICVERKALEFIQAHSAYKRMMETFSA